MPKVQSPAALIVMETVSGEAVGAAGEATASSGRGEDDVAGEATASSGNGEDDAADEVTVSSDSGVEVGAADAFVWEVDCTFELSVSTEFSQPEVKNGVRQRTVRTHKQVTGFEKNCFIVISILERLYNKAKI
ncbi:MAG: hypothetical protein SO170_08080 [Butyribacter sp.]|nr:hypothetical protein [bacterium]MDY3854892.1 hypothetical protein [Butyribacter sp.]